MLEFIAQYWLQFIFGLIITGMGITLKKVWSLYKKEQNEKHNEEKEKILKEVDERMQDQEKHIMSTIGQQHQEMIETDTRISQEISSINENVNKLANGLLSIQRATFINTCKEYLSPEHKITPEEYERLVQDHDTYNTLGGNNIGDKYFNLIEQKFASSVSI